MGDRKHFLLRIPEELHEALEKWAADEMRSVNGQLEFLLTEAVRRSGRLRPSSTESGDRLPPD